LKEAVDDLKAVLAAIGLRGCHWTIGIMPTWGSAWAATSQGPEERFSRAT
jgi:hypothetical protein